MHTASPVALFLLVIASACSNNPEDVGQANVIHSMPRSLAGARHAPKDVEHYDIVNRTCALYVALRSHAWETPIAFGSEMDDGMLHWNKCPTGNMIACATVSTPTGDTALAGIPWPYHP